MRVLVCGDRKWRNRVAVGRELLKRKDRIKVLIEGGALGADAIGKEYAEHLGIPVMEFPANWARFGRSAGPIRNKSMLRFGEPDLVLAFHSDLRKSKGTKNMVKAAKKAGIPVKVFKK